MVCGIKVVIFYRTVSIYNRQMLYLHIKQKKAMEESRQIFGARLATARKMRGLSMKELCDRMGGKVTQQAISKYEHGQAMPRSGVFIEIAEALDLPFDYFAKPIEVEIDKIEYKRKPGIGKREEEMYGETVRDAIDRYLTIEQLLAADGKPRLPRYGVSTVADAKEAARGIREKWKLGNSGIANVMEAMENHGVMVVSVEAGDGFEGMCGLVDGRPFIVTNSRHQSEKKRHTALHELGHLVLDLRSVDGEAAERLCDSFASEVLIPEATLKAKIGDKRHDISLEELRDLQRTYGISAKALMAKAHESGIISDNRYKTFAAKMSNPDFADAVGANLFQSEESNRFRRLVFRALASEILSTSKAASLLREPVNEVMGQLELM